MSMARRHRIFSFLCKTVKELVGKSPPGEFLFGPSLGDQVKGVKTLEKLGKELQAPILTENRFSKKKGKGAQTPYISKGNQPPYDNAVGAQQNPFSSSGAQQPSFSRSRVGGSVPLNRKDPAHLQRETRPQGRPSKENYSARRRY